MFLRICAFLDYKILFATFAIGINNTKRKHLLHIMTRQSLGLKGISFIKLIVLATILSISAKAKSEVDHKAFNTLAIFTDESCSQIKEGVTAKQIKKISSSFHKELATKIFDGTYDDAEYRIQSYRSYQTPKVSAARTKTMHTWGILDNVTGMFVDNPDKDLIILVGDTKGLNVKLRIQDFAKGWGGQTVELKTGLNRVKPETAGLCYIIIHQDEYIPLNPTNEDDEKAIDNSLVNIHFIGGKVNGYYDSAKNTAADSNKLIANAEYPYFDVKGKYSQLVWYSEDFKDANTDLHKTISYLDQLVAMEIDFSGFFKYGKPFSTRMFFMPSANGKGNPNATIERVIFPRAYKNFFASPSEETLLSRIWGMAHEVGHCTQSNPGMRWGGMGEVGNNMFSMFIKTQMFGYEKSNMLVEGYYEKATELILDKEIAHADKSISSKHFERLVPFWQLHLFTTKVLGYEDLYRDLYEHYRTTPNVGTTFESSGPLQLDFVRNVCNLSKTNLLDFFDKWGFLKPIDVVVNDYGNRVLKISQYDIDNLRQEIESKNYPTPAQDITKIRDDNFYQFTVK